MARKTKAARNERISRAFRQEYPEFADRATALDVTIQIIPRRKKDKSRAYVLDGVRQMAGYTYNEDGSPFTREDAIRQIDRLLTDVEDDRLKMESMTVAERFARVLGEFRLMKPQYRMFGQVHLPGGDGGSVLFMADYDGQANLRGLGIVASAKVPWERDDRSVGRMAAFCDALAADFDRRQKAAAS